MPEIQGSGGGVPKAETRKGKVFCDSVGKDPQEMVKNDLLHHEADSAGLC